MKGLFMNIETLEYIYYTYQYGSFSQAALELSTSYSTVAKRIERAEEELGVQLFDRATRGASMRLTPVGSLIMNHIETIVLSYKKIQETIDKQKNPRDILRIGYGYTYPRLEEYEIISQFIKQNPRIQVGVSADRRDGSKNKLLMNALDGIFVHDIQPEPHGILDFPSPLLYESIPITSNKVLSCIVSSNNPLAQKKILSSQDLDQMRKQKLLIISSENGKVSNYRRQLVSIFRDQLPQMQMFDGSNLRMLQYMLEDDNTFFLTGRRISDEILSPGTASIPYEKWDHSCDLYFIYKKENIHNKALAQFIQVVRQYADSLSR